MNLVSLVLLACAVCISADTESLLWPTSENIVDNLIVGGSNAEEGQFPYQISLRSTQSKQHFCGGSILTSRYLITAAHCTQGINSHPNFVYAVVGSFKRLSGGVKIPLAKITPHERYNPSTVLNDVSILQTAVEITFTEFIQPIGLPSSNSEGGVEVVLSGWGRTNYPPIAGKPSLPNILQFTNPHTINKTECIKRFRYTPAASKIQDSNLCTLLPKNVGACMGDSGGPLVDPKNKVLVGIVSWGIPCGRGYPDVFTRVFSHLDWIKQHIDEGN